MSSGPPTATALRFYQVTCIGEIAGDDSRRLLALAPETDPRMCLPVHEHENIGTEPGRWYEFTDGRRTHQVPLTAEEAEKLRGQDWQLEEVPGPLGVAEQRVLEQREDRLRAEAERLAARERQAAESRRLAEDERNDRLWFARLYLKIPHNLSPREWREIEADYHERWCEPRGILYRRENPNSALALNYKLEGRPRIALDMDELRCIVFGWGDPRDPEDLRRAVHFYREKGRSVVRLLQPILFSQSPGPRLARALAELEQRRAEVDQTLDDWPHSPLALARFEETLCAELGLPDLEAPVRGTAVPFDVGDEKDRILRYRSRWSRLETLRATVKPQLKASGWMLTDGRLVESRPRRKGPKPDYISHVVGGLYLYLQPIYQRTFGDDTQNPGLLREHISRLLSPFFEVREISPAWKGRIWNVINNLLNPDEQAASSIAEVGTHRRPPPES